MKPKKTTTSRATRAAGPLVYSQVASRLQHPDLFDEHAPADLAEPSTAEAKKAASAASRHRQHWDEAFTSWKQAMLDDGTLRSAASVRAYEQLWQPLGEWAVKQAPAVDLDRLTEEDLTIYIDSREGRGEAGHQISPRHAWRLLSLVDRVLVHRATLVGQLAANRCAERLLKSKPEWRYAHTPEYEPQLEHLSAQEAKQLVQFLTESMPRSGRRGAFNSWREMRAATAVALHLGGGLTPAEVRELGISDVKLGARMNLATRVSVKAHSQTPQRDVPIAGWAARIVRQWLEVRETLGMQGEWLLPSTISGNQWKKASHSNAVNEMLELSGLPIEALEGGCFRLRHTFALRQLARGTSLSDLGALLGLRDEDALARYRAIVPSRVTVY